MTSSYLFISNKLKQEHLYSDQNFVVGTLSTYVHVISTCVCALQQMLLYNGIKKVASSFLIFLLLHHKVTECVVTTWIIDENYVYLLMLYCDDVMVFEKINYN